MVLLTAIGSIRSRQTLKIPVNDIPRDLHHPKTIPHFPSAPLFSQSSTHFQNIHLHDYVLYTEIAPLSPPPPRQDRRLLPHQWILGWPPKTQVSAQLKTSSGWSSSKLFSDVGFTDDEYQL